MPLIWTRKVKFNQPIFFCNNLAGECLSSVLTACADLQALQDCFLLCIQHGKLHMPISRVLCNGFDAAAETVGHCTGEVWSTEEGGGPHGSLPPYSFVLYFKNGVGTLLPLFYSILESVQKAHERRLQSHDDIQESIATAFIDPSDSSVIHLTQPGDLDRIPTAPKYAPNYGADEQYEDMSQ